MFPTKKVIGIIGGGQLGKMLIEASRPWNNKNIVLESSADCPASLVADEVIEGSLYDADAIRSLAQKCDVLTFEIEHINCEVLLELEAEGKNIIPSPRVLKVIQDKGLQKQFYSELQLNTAPYILIETQEELLANMHTFTGDKLVVKSRTGGYDGKGVRIVNKSEVQSGNFILTYPAVIEQFYEDVSEFAVIVARDGKGAIKTFPLIEMFFNPESNLVEFLFSPARISEEVAAQCTDLAIKAISGFDGVGLFAVELFVTQSNEVLINEIAPRPHNSGHHTIECCYTSQFEQLNRILLDLPLGSTDLIEPAAMINLVGGPSLAGAYQLTHADKILQMEGVYIHLYNKKEIRPARKMGHITVMAKDLETLLSKASEIKKLTEFKAI